MRDSWQAGLRRAGDVDKDDGSRLACCVGSVQSLPSGERGEGAERLTVSGGASLFLGSRHHLACAAGSVRALEHRLETVVETEQGWRPRRLFCSPGRSQRDRSSGADVRRHDRACPCIRGRRERGQKNQALGRSRRGFSTKIHLKTDAPYRSTTKTIPKIFGKALHRGRARIEQTIAKLKRCKRIALPCEKTKQNVGSPVAIAGLVAKVTSPGTCALLRRASSAAQSLGR